MTHLTPQRRRIQPKLRSMPSRHTPSALYMQLHQLANEKERLQQELAMLNDRHSQINTRLQEIERHIARMESTVADPANPMPTTGIKLATQPACQQYKTMTIDY